MFKEMFTGCTEIPDTPEKEDAMFVPRTPYVPYVPYRRTITKVHIISADDALTVQNAVNNFIKDKNVKDIQYSALLAGSTIVDRVMIVYTELEDLEDATKNIHPL